MDVNTKGQKLTPVRYRLPNGLTVLLVESHKSPVVSVQMWVRTGSADEAAKERGISHFIEHLVFKGSDKFGVGEIASVVEGAGGELNAYTSFDQTVFYVTISQAFCDTGLEVISQMMGFPRFDPQEIDNEREVVIEEIKRGEDSLSRQSSQLLFSSSFKKHSYGVPVIGYDRIIRKISPKTLGAYYHSRYVPQNMFLVVAGDFAAAEMKKKIRHYFGSIPSRRLRKVVRTREPAQKQPRITVKKGAFEECQFHIAWKIPPALHKDIPALDVLAMIFGQGESSRLNQRLRVHQGLVNHVYASSFTPNDAGLFTISVGLAAEKLPVALDALIEELGRLVGESVQADEIQKAINSLESDDFYGRETVDGLARKIGFIEHLAGDQKFYARYMKAVRALKATDLLRVARHYLRPELVNLSMITPNSASQGQSALKRWLKSYRKVFKQAKARRIFIQRAPSSGKLIKKASSKAQLGRANEISKMQLPNGAILLMRPNYDTHVVSLRTGFLGGIRAEPQALTGLTELLSRSWTGGTQTLSESEIQSQMDRCASQLSAFGGRNTVGLSLDTLDHFAPQTSAIYMQVLAQALMPETVIEREKQMMIEALKTRQDNPAQIASLLFLEKMFGDHPYGRDAAGTEASIAKLSSKNVLDFLRQQTRAENCVVALSGAIDPELWQTQLTQCLELLPKNAAVENKINLPILAADQLAYKSLQKSQTHIIHGYRALTFKSTERIAIQLLQSILAGQGGRLFIELRDKASLAYSVAPMRMEGIDTGYFGAYIGCSPEKGELAIKMMKAELSKLAEKPVPEEELTRSKRYLIGRHDIELQRNSAIASHILFDQLYGLDFDELYRFADRVNAVTGEELRRLAERLFAANSVTVAVGPTCPWA